MIKRVLLASSIVLASPLLAGPAAAAHPNWTAIGQAMLPTYGNAQLFLDKGAAKRPDMASGQLRAVLAAPWMDPKGSGYYNEVDFRLLANCREGTFALQPTWPEGPDVTGIRDKELRRPLAGSADDKLLKAVCS
jgi:hypothetical protein